MNLTEQVAQLKTVLPQLKPKDQDFAIDLIAAFQKKKGLSPKQEPWVGKLLERALAPAQPVEAINVGVFQGVLDLFAKAKSAKLKYPKITLVCLGKMVTLSVAGASSKQPGSVNVVGEGKFPDREWFGRVSPEGLWVPSPKTAPEMVMALAQLLSKFGSQPARVAKEHGKLTGQCCFCNSPLTDAKSLAAGFGPTCAAHYGLTTDWKLAVAKNELVAGTEATELSKAVEDLSNEEVATANDLFAAIEAQEKEEQTKVACFFCEVKSSHTQVLHGYVVCKGCAAQLTK